MTMYLIYSMTVMMSCLLMLIALTIRAHKVGRNGTITSNEATFLMAATIAVIVPGLNLMVPICYLYRIIKQ